MNDIIEQYKMKNGNRLRIVYDLDPQDPREWDNTGFLCIRKHRNYKFPNELDFDFDNYDDVHFAIKSGEKLDDYDKENYAIFETLEHNHYIFWLDSYEHSWISFSLAWGGMQCKRDTSNNCWFIAVPKRDKLPNEDIWTTRTEEEAKNIALNEIDTRNKYLNGEMYGYQIMKPVKRTNEEGREKIEWEFEESCYWYYDIKEIIWEFEDQDLEEID